VSLLLQALSHLVSIRQLVQERADQLPIFAELQRAVISELAALLEYLHHTVSDEKSQEENPVATPEPTITVRAGVSDKVSCLSLLEGNADCN